MFKVKIKEMKIHEYCTLGYKTINHASKAYRIMCPVEIETDVDYITTTKDFRWWGLKQGKNHAFAVPIYPLTPTNSERIEEGLETY